MTAGPAWAGISGRYAETRGILSSSEESHDQARAERLWDVSEALLREASESAPPRLASGVAALALATCVSLALLAGFGPAMAGETTRSPVGTWRNDSDDGSGPRALIRIDEGPNGLTGTLFAALRPGEDIHRLCGKCPGALRNHPYLGLPFLTGLQRNGDLYDGGSVPDPETGQFFAASGLHNAGGEERGAGHPPRRSGQHRRSKMAEDAELDVFRQAVNCASVLERMVSFWKLDVRESTRRALK